MRTTLILAAATAVLFAAPAFAEDQNAQPSTPSADNPVICKVEQAATGSRIGARRICMTRNEGLAREQGDRPTVDQAASASLRAAMPGN